MIKAKKSTAFVLCGILAVMTLLCISVWALLSDAVRVSAASNATVSGYEEQIKDLEKKEKELKAEIEALKNDSTKAMKLKTTLDAQLTVTYEKIDAALKLIEELELQISNTNADIEQKKQELAKQEEIFKQRMRLAYEETDVSYLVMLFESDGLVDFFNNVERVIALLEYDNKVIAKYNEQKNDLEKTKADLNEQREKLNAYEVELEQTEADLDQQIKEVDALIEKLNKDKDNYQDELSDVQRDAERLEAELEAYLKKLQEEENKNYMVEGQLQWPVSTSTKNFNRITSWYGYRDLTVSGNNVSNHKGIDIGVSYVDVLSAGKGTVVTATYSNSYGYYVVIDHGGGVSTLYAHLSKLIVKKGDSVLAGQKIAVSGNTGWSTGPHLHFELRIWGEYKNPLTTKDSNGKLYLSQPANLKDAS